jgi:hypothetical protein
VINFGVVGRDAYLKKPLLPAGVSTLFINGLFLFRPRRSAGMRFAGVFQVESVFDRQWQGHGPEFTLSWGSRTWGLDLGRANPGLRPIGGDSATKLLCLEGLAQVGRSDLNAFNPMTLISFEHHRTRIEAVFAPTGWGGSIVRAAWSPTATADGIDLEVQIGATSVDELKGVEVWVRGDRQDSLGDQSPVMGNWVEPRDAPSAAFSYDGRESLHALRALSTLPLPSSSPFILRPWICAPNSAEPDTHYIEMVQPNDVARRIACRPLGAGASTRSDWSVRCALFGYDLEKGVILRARLRGIWIRSKSPENDANSLLEEFLREPLPLGP